MCDNAVARLIQTRGGRTNLHVWRGGRSYERQKGHIYRQEWNNLLFSIRPQPPGESHLLYFDVRKPLPYPAETFDAINAFHIIEHLTPEEAGSFLGEAFRVLKPFGILRLSTPDLENVCRAYLDRMADYDRSPSEFSRVRYEWSVLELLDQITRVRSGGLMQRYVEEGRFDHAYAKERFGDVFEDFGGRPRADAANGKSAAERTARLTPGMVLRGVGRRFRRAARFPWRDGALSFVPDFRNSGETNKWLYDHLSVTTLLAATGFLHVRRQTYKTSDIPDWEKFDLDRSTCGDYPIEPSLYVEARKPKSPQEDTTSQVRTSLLP
jgi:SAM-dependent methyltransferase